MKHTIVFLLTVVQCCVSLGVRAATEQISSTGYDVVTKAGEKTTLPNGTVVMTGVEDHASLVSDKGEQTSEWCNYDAWVDDKGVQKAFVGHCSIFYDGGDVLWLAITGTTEDQPSTWTALGGTGRFVGATGGGTSKTTSVRSDGYAATYKASGTLTTK